MWAYKNMIINQNKYTIYLYKEIKYIGFGKIDWYKYVFIFNKINIFLWN